MKALLVSLLLLLAACSSGGEQEPLPAASGTRAFGERCANTEDCASGLCIRVDSSSGVCTRACVDDHGCPSSPNWKCVAPDGLGTTVCGCRKLAAQEICGNGLDDECNGKADDCRMCGGRPVPDDDHENCGACGNACRSDQSCQGGKCACDDASLTDCSSCVDVKTDASNCGACGKACPAAQSCRDGACVCPDAGEPDLCGDACVDRKTDSNNCGACGKVCPSAQVCVAGACVCPDAGKPDLCSDTCVDRMSDRSHCGTCDETCGTGESCVAGACTCAGGTTRCGGACVNTAYDRANCGSCGHACGPEETCSGGMCTCLFGSPCGGHCISFAADPANCGSCGHACGPGETCSGGACNCASSLVCGGTCVPVDDPGNCGACGNACPSGQTCSGGKCVCSASGLTACGASCVDAASDVANCGACGKTCRPTEICGGGTCGCPGGKTYCTSAASCVALSTDTSNCGTCGKTCRATEACSGGSCVCPAYGQKWCASTSACTDTLSNAAHCGACDHACPVGTSCASGVCTCTTSGLTLCGSTCVDTKTDAANCGGCGKACGGTFVCKASACVCDTPIAAAPVRLTNALADSTYPTAVWSGSNVGIAYWDARGTGKADIGNVYFALLNADGTRALATDLQLTTFGTDVTYTPPSVVGPPSLVWTGTQFTVAWSERVALPADAGSGTRTRLHLRGISPAGVALPMDVVVDPTGTTGDTGVMGAGIAWTPADGYVVAYYPNWTSSLVFRKLGPAATTPSLPTLVTLGGGGSYEGGEIRVVPGATGWGLMASDPTATTFVRIDADGARTKPVVPIAAWQPRAAADIVFDGTTFVATWIRQDWGTKVAMVLARGDDLATQFDVDTWTADPYNSPYYSPRIAVSGGVVDLLFARNEATDGTGRISFRRLKLAGTSPPISITSTIDVLTTSNADAKKGYAFVRAGASGFAAWSDTRWGDREVYVAPLDLRGCP